MYPERRKEFREDVVSMEDFGVYSKEGREQHIAEGQIRGWEDGFMMGYEESFDELADETPEDSFEEIN